MAATRRLAAVMFTDVAGYTSLSQDDEAAALRLLQEQERLVRGLLEIHRGRLVKSIGDGFLIEFANARDAVDCAVDLQRHIHERNLRTPPPALNVRIGIHLGDVEGAGPDIVGDTVNVASRIEPLAELGGICLSAQVYDQVRNKVPYQLDRLGPKTLKGIREPVEVYRVVSSPTSGEGQPMTESGPRRIAVLPFVSMSPDPNDEYFADGLTEELITKISLVNGLEVIARTSAMNYKKKEKNASQIGKELRVGTLLEGSVRKSGNRVRVSAQLIDAKTEGHLWAESYDRDLQDIFEIQGSVAESVAGALKLKILGGEGQKVEPTDSVEAYTMYLKGLQLAHGGGGEVNRRQAIALFEGALSKDPKFARAYAGLAVVWLHMTEWMDFVACVNKAEAAARTALNLGPESAEAHAAMAAVHGARDRFEDSRLELEEAIRINPNLAEANHGLGETYSREGRLDEAIESFRKAHSLDPLNPGHVVLLTHVLRIAGRVDEALEMVQSLKEAHRGEDWVYGVPAMCYAQQQDFSRALGMLDRGLESFPDSRWLRMGRGFVYARLGRRRDAIAELQGLMADASEAHRLDAQVWIRSALGDIDEAYVALMRQAELQSWNGFIGIEPLLGELRKDPRFSEFSKKVGLRVR